VALADRPTTDLVLLILATTIGLTILFAGAGLMLLEALHPEVDTTAASTSLGHIIAVIVGVVVGYVAGGRRSPSMRE
jgi:hypothetical protein